MNPSITVRVPRHTAEHINELIRCQTETNVAQHAAAGPEAIDRRLAELDREWDIDRALEAHAATATLVGLTLGTTVSRKLLFIPAVAAGLMLLHALRGWCPRVPVFRRLGFRTLAEIDQERTALQTLRASFRDRPSGDSPRQEAGQQVLEAVRR